MQNYPAIKKIITLLPFLLLPILFTYSFPSTDSYKMVFVIFLAAWMVLWWVTEILPLGVTALIPLILLPVAGIIPLKDVSPHYSNPVVYLFLGGFMIARALEKTKLSERIAMTILSITGKSDQGILIGFIASTALLSMWISNTATAVMMLPIAISVIKFLEDHVSPSERPSLKPLSVAVYISIAYAANIGGIATPIGTPPNVVFVGYLESLYKIKIDFWRWLVVMTPVMLLMLVLMFFTLKILFPFKIDIGKDFRKFVKAKLNDLGPTNKEQKITLSIFLLTCFLWITKDILAKQFSAQLFNDTSIAILGGALLFLVPVTKNWSRVLDVKDLNHLPWDIVLLFGGGIALATSLETAGIIQGMTNYFASFNFGNAFLLILTLSVLVLLLTEVMSNVALCVVALPVILKIGEAQGIAPVMIGLPAAICSSFAFMMPISTPPNAIVFATQAIKSNDMFKAGLWLNIIGVVSIMSLGWFFMRIFLV